MFEKVPSGWQVVSVKDLIDTHFSGPSPTCEERNIQTESEWGVFKTTAVTWSGFNEFAHKTLPQSYWGQKHLEVKAGDVLVTKAGPRHRVGVVVHVPATQPRLIVSGKMIGLRLKAEYCESDVIAGLLSQAEPQKYLDDRSTGMAESQVNFTNTALLNTTLLLPPKEERALISEIGQQLEIQIRQTEAIVAKLQQVKQGLLRDLLTRGIDASGQLRPPYEQAPELYKESPLGEIPKEWDARTLQEISSTPICYGIVQVFGYVADGVPVLAIRDLLGDYSTNIHRTAHSIDAGYTRSRVKGGDVLISVKATIGRIGVVPNHFEGNISRDIAKIRPSAGVSSNFLCFLLRSPLGQKTLELSQVGTTRAELSIAPLKELFFPIPPLKEQERIDTVISSHEALIKENESNLTKLKQQKFGLMDDLLTGKVRVNKMTKQQLSS
ncbi:restriction endonuclease subunit S [uncultured Amphritea sp.]|uniref:restriction endonuclease subunit S n=1 Tax=uncultured Amphritea sp. TaxID=981605 RepID=UPI0026361987|nr:restriction endonuclease subunit S [uncultured Amphritea sp.]